jgi:hypothetical protein
MPPKIILDTDTLRPDRLCQICRLPLVTRHQPLVITCDSWEPLTKSRHLSTYHASCHTLLEKIL